MYRSRLTSVKFHKYSCYGSPLVSNFDALCSSKFKSPALASTRRLISSITSWNESDIITDRKSRFQARCVAISSPEDVQLVLDQFIQQHKSIAKNASHPHIIAWRTATVEIGTSGVDTIKLIKRGVARKESLPKYSNVEQGYKDNGEKGAGSRLLEQVIVHNNLYNILVLVTRWYGGNPIGSSRFRHINNAAMISLRKGGIIP
ncbi:uncharacterized protein RJT20DRAFT_8348 [Scheffersomyces xylosifermentans]|uniref:uncharacterized protein n=1 Tax=Scheffersomyces xylosifermentans TaxID=1304137 RepID=UPI00315DDB12